MDRNRALNLLSLARKGGNIQLGEENVGAASRAGQARLIVVASDAATCIRTVRESIASQLSIRKSSPAPSGLLTGGNRR